ncbi:MAG: LLM class flavin-dependent oxidoreductase [Rhizobiales bacterium]|nr:LLM class flavin-dependent oxidoreductase [Hyphomicrobiales bacterium]
MVDLDLREHVDQAPRAGSHWFQSREHRGVQAACRGDLRHESLCRADAARRQQGGRCAQGVLRQGGGRQIPDGRPRRRVDRCDRRMMQFGVFDHLDRNDLPLATYYEARLKIIESYDRFGFYAYHVAEHHSTPIGLAPSPSVFLSAVAQRTQRLRFGPMVYALPLYHPIRMIEEICMLDQMSGGRLEMGFGRGSVGVELAYYGEDPKLAQEVYAEALELVLKGLTEPVLTFHGRFFNFDHVPMELTPLQKPYPPVWYGLHAPESAKRAAHKRLRVISLDSVPATCASFDVFRASWREAWGDIPLPLMGLGRFIVVAETDAEALALARRAYPRWHDSFTYLHRLHKFAAMHPRPSTFDGIVEVGQGVAGSPRTVAAFLREQLAAAGSNYCVGQFAFGDLSPDETQRSIALFARAVMPELRSVAPAPAI